jgi:hypothetical protein
MSVDTHMSLRQLTARRSTRARQILHGACDHANAQRIMKVLKGRTGQAGYFAARHAADMLPSIIRAEAQQARAAAHRPPKAAGGADAYHTAVERAVVLERWASQSEFQSVKDAALALVRKMMTEKTLEQTT